MAAILAAPLARAESATPAASTPSCCAASEPTTTPAAAGVASCCAPTPAPKAESCCAPESPNAAQAGARPSRLSLYHAEGTFTDDAGREVKLAALRGRPVVVAMFFASCGYACPMTVTHLQALQGRLPAGAKDTAFVLVSFDTARDTTEVLARYRRDRQLDGAWTLLRGNDEAVRELAALLGVNYKREADGGFAHSNLFTILNREGEITHVRTGLQGGLDEAAAALARLTK